MDTDPELELGFDFDGWIRKFDKETKDVIIPLPAELSTTNIALAIQNNIQPHFQSQDNDNSVNPDYWYTLVRIHANFPNRTDTTIITNWLVELACGIGRED